jgi:lysine N6-hydroxylase
MTMTHHIVGVGVGPFNLSLAALAEPLRENHSLNALFLDDKAEFSWHPGMMVDGARLQVPFLADLVSLTDPTSRFSVLNWLRETDRLYGFYFAENLFLERREYEAYCRWAAARLPFCRFGANVTSVSLDEATDEFEVCYTTSSGTKTTVRSANVVLGIGTAPSIPETLRTLADENGAVVCHSAEYLSRSDLLRELPDVTVVGSGQSGAEVVLDLLRHGVRGQRVRWLTRTTAFEPMEYSKLGLEHFTPDYTRYFHGLDAEAKADLLGRQGRLHKAISAETIADLHAELHARTFSEGGYGQTLTTLIPEVEVTGGTREPGSGDLVLDCRHRRRGESFQVETSALVLATGYAERDPACLAPLAGSLDRDTDGRMAIGLDYRVGIQGSAAGLYVQNAELHTHGVGAPDLGLAAHRAAVIINAVTGRCVYRLPARTAHTSFAPSTAATHDAGIILARRGLPHPRVSPVSSTHFTTSTTSTTGIEVITDVSDVTHSAS